MNFLVIVGVVVVVAGKSACEAGTVLSEVSTTRGGTVASEDLSLGVGSVSRDEDVSGVDRSDEPVEEVPKQPDRSTRLVGQLSRSLVSSSSFDEESSDEMRGASNESREGGDMTPADDDEEEEDAYGSAVRSKL